MGAMIRVNEESAHKVWGYLEAGDDIDTICSALPSVGERTIERLRAVMNGFKQGKTNKELANDEWNERTIDERREWWRDYLRSKQGWSRQIHLDGIAKAAQQLRSRIINPEIRKRIYGQNTSVWFWNGLDWRIIPSYWFSVMVPLIDHIDAWIPKAEDLLEHLKDSRFMKHYKELEKGTNELQGLFNNEIKRLKNADYSYKCRFQEYDEVLDVFFVDNFAPDAIPTQEEIDELNADLLVFEDLTALLLDGFKKSCPDLDKQCEQLERLLQQVYDDLEADVVASEIETSRCSRCK